ncbi:MAG: KEOPS complex N(6)-L-threonylcarbamoyladenine synthase Kae1 [Candidatus Aenigmatarchaeota archaeon]
MISLGIESTAHTFGIGIVNDKSILANTKSVYVPEKKGSGIHPVEAMNHHNKVKEDVLEQALTNASLKLDNIDIISYAAGPGLPPCLRVGLDFAKQLGKKLMPVNHCIAHIEIGRLLTGCEDPLVLYVSGGNTQLIGYASGKYRVFGETLDIAIGNAIDSFMREIAKQKKIEMNSALGGAMLEEIASKGKNYIELPYVVKGMDLSFSGIVSAALQKLKKDNNISIHDLCFSFQETCYAMLTEVTERALAHTGKNELLLTGGVAASLRLRSMLETMCNERGVKLFSCPREYSGDNGTNIAWTGLLMCNSGCKSVAAGEADFIQKWRTDDVDVTWR